MAAQRDPFIGVEQYLALEREAECKSEYLGGRICAMAGGRPTHNQIGFGLATALGGQLRRGPCRGYTRGQRVYADGLMTYPDLNIVCGQCEFYDDRRDTLTNPTLVLEVLSPSTERWDRSGKSAHYRAVESLREYVFVSQEEPRIERYLRQPDGSWRFEEAVGTRARIKLESIGCELNLGDVYAGIEFGAPAVGDSPLEESDGSSGRDSRTAR